MSSPRETGTSRPSARVLRTSRTAAALLLTTVAASAPVSRASHASTWVSRSPRLPVARSISRFVAERAASAIASTATSGSSARPRLVCRTVPVRLRTGRREGATAARARRRAASATRRSVSSGPSPFPPVPAAPGSVPRSCRLRPVSQPGGHRVLAGWKPAPQEALRCRPGGRRWRCSREARRTSARRSSIAPRTASTTSSRPCSRAHASISGRLRIRSTPGRRARLPPSSPPPRMARPALTPRDAAAARSAPSGPFDGGRERDPGPAEPAVPPRNLREILLVVVLRVVELRRLRRSRS